MPKKGKANSKANSKKTNVQETLENRTTRQETPEQQSDIDRKAQLHERDLQELRSETSELAGEMEQEPTLEQSQPIEELPVAPQIESNLSPTNVNESNFTKPASTVGSISSEEHRMNGVEGHFELPQVPGAETVDLPVSHAESDEKDAGENTEKITNGVTDDTHNEDSLNNTEAQDNAINGAAGDTSSDIANNTSDNVTKFIGETTNDTPNSLNGITSDQHHDTVNHAETTGREVPTKPSEPVLSGLAEPIEQASEQPMPIKPAEPTESIEPKEQEDTKSARVPEPAEYVKSIEPVDATKRGEPAEPVAPSESKGLEPAAFTDVVETTGISEPAVEPEVTAMVTGPTESVEPTVSARTTEPAESAEPIGHTVSTEAAEPVGPTQPASNSVSLGSSSEEGIQATTGHTQSSVGSPIFETWSSTLSHAAPEPESAVVEPQPALNIAQSTGSAPNAASPGHPSPSVPYTASSTDSTFPAQSEVSSVPQTSLPLSKTSSSITPVTPARKVCPIESPTLRPRSRSFVPQPPQPSSPLRPVRLPSPAQQATIPAQKGAPPTPLSVSPASRASSFAQRGVSPSQSNGVHVPIDLSNPISRFQVFNSPAQDPTYPTHRASPDLKAASSTPRACSPPPKIGSPLIHPYHYPMVSAHPSLPQQMVHPVPTMYPNAYPQGPGFATALQSPALSAGFLPPYTQSAYANVPPFPQHSSQPHPYGHQHQYSGYSDPNYPNSLRGFQNPSAINGLGIDSKGIDKGLDGKENAPPLDGDGEPLQLLQRIQDAIPDMGRVLHGYKSAKSRLLAREAEIKQMRTENEQTVMRKDYYIEALQSQLRKTTQENAEETHQLKSTVKSLRTEIGNIQGTQKDTAKSLLEAQKSNRLLFQWRTELESHISNLDNDLKEVQEGHEKEIERLKGDHVDILTTQKRELDEAFEGIRVEDSRTHSEALATREKELLAQQESMKSDYENQKEQMQQAHAAMQANFDSKVAELESIETELSNAKSNLDAKHKELEDVRGAHVNKVQAMDDEFNEKRRQWEEHCSDLETQVSQKTDELTASERERERLEGVCENKEQQLQQAIGEMNMTMGNMNNDCDRLRKILANLGEVTDIKNSKGDTFFLDCFGQLFHQIASLSEEHFAYLPNDPPKDILSKIPSELPSFLDNTPASCKLRSAYIQHLISKTLYYRIFQPFLFTLSHRPDKEKADSYLQSLSLDIRRKSVRREAFWRQQTLRAAYTASDAKQSINAVARTIVNEIVELIMPFADSSAGCLDTLGLAVQRIVKLAVETWRHARVEREIILALFPAPDAEGMVNGEWGESGTMLKAAGSINTPSSPTSSASTSGGSISARAEGGRDSTRHVVLRVVPRIIREAAHGDFVEVENPDQEHERASPCVYSAGEVLYSDSPVVMARRQELARDTACL